MTTHTAQRAFRAVVNPISAVAIAIFAATAAQAQVVAITATQLDALGSISVPMVGTPPDTFQPAFVTAVGTQTVTITNGGTPANGKRLQRRDQQGGSNAGNFGGDFAPDTQLLTNVVGSNVTSSADGMNIAFRAPVRAFGFNFDPNLFLAPTDFTFIVFEGATQTIFTLPGILNRAQGNNTAPFFGIQETGGNLITSVLIFGTAVPNPQPSPPRQLNVTPNDFAVGGLRFNIVAAAPVPEPGNIALVMGMAVTGTGCLIRRKRSLANK